MGAFDYEVDFSENVELYVDEIVEHMLWSCKEVVRKLRDADERNKRDYDKGREFV